MFQPLVVLQSPNRIDLVPDFAAFRIKHADVRPASLEPDHFVSVVSFRVEQHDGFLRLCWTGQVERHLLRQFVVTRPLEGRKQTESLPLVVIDGHEDSGAPGPDAGRVLEGSEQFLSVVLHDGRFAGPSNCVVVLEQRQPPSGLDQVSVVVIHNPPGRSQSKLPSSVESQCEEDLGSPQTIFQFASQHLSSR